MAHLWWAAPGLPVEERNTHPFRCGQTAFAHNGGIYRWTGSRRCSRPSGRRG